MEEPEVNPRHRVVVARVAQIQEAQQVLIDEVEPEKPVVLARSAAHGENEIGRITKSGQHVPRSGNEQNDQHAGERPQPLPRSTSEKLPG
jgi:hypothetical protein